MLVVNIVTKASVYLIEIKSSTGKIQFGLTDIQQSAEWQNTITPLWGITWLDNYGFNRHVCGHAVCGTNFVHHVYDKNNLYEIVIPFADQLWYSFISICPGGHTNHSGKWKPE